MAVPMGISPQGVSRWHFILNAITRGMNATQTYFSLREAGVGYRKTTMLKDFSLASEIGQREKTMKYIGKGKTILDPHYSLALHPLAGGFRQTVIEIYGQDTRTKEWITRHVTVAHDKMMHREDIELDATLAIQGTSPWLEIKSMKPVVARKYPYDWLA